MARRRRAPRRLLLGRDLVEEAEAVCASLGAQVLQAPGGEERDRRLAAITTFPAAVALSRELALRSALDSDRPAWVDAYYKTAAAISERARGKRSALIGSCASAPRELIGPDPDEGE